MPEADVVRRARDGKLQRPLRGALEHQHFAWVIRCVSRSKYDVFGLQLQLHGNTLHMRRCAVDLHGARKAKRLRAARGLREI